MSKQRLLSLMLLALVVLSACSVSRQDEMPPPYPSPPGLTEPSKPPDTSPPAEAEPLAIKAIDLPEGQPFVKDWTIVPWGPFHVTTRVTGASEFTLAVARYGTEAGMVVIKPDSCSGDSCTFTVEHQTSHRLLFVEAYDKDGQRVYESRQILAIAPKLQDFKTILQGSATGWASEHDQAVRELFQEGKVLWFDSPEEFAVFAARLKELIGVTVPAVEWNGKTILVVLGQPAHGPRPFEVVGVDKPSGPPGTVADERVSLLMKYANKPTSQGPPTLSYHILATDLSALVRPLRLATKVVDAAWGDEIGVQESSATSPRSPLAIKALDLPGGRPFSNGWTLLPWGPMRVTTTVTGAAG